MKKIAILIIAIFLGLDSYSQYQLTFRVANPRIVRLTTIDYLEFEVQVKANSANSYAFAIQANFTYNLTAFGSTLNAVKTGISAGFDPSDNPKYSFTKSYASNKINITITTTHTAFDPATETISDYYNEVPISWTPLIKLQCRILDNTGIADIMFAQATMNPQEFYVNPIGGVGTSSLPYTNPNLYDESKTLQSCYLQRIFSGAFNWTQVAGSVNWNTSVNTSVWDGSATITQADYTEALANNVRVESDATLTIPSNKWLTVSGNMTILGAAPNLMVASGGSLIQNTPGVQATVGRDVAAWTSDSHGWHLLSSPVAGQTVSPAFTDPTPGNYDFYKWSETSDLWLNQKIPGNNITSFDQGIGYLVAYQTSATKLFTGSLNVANVSGLNLTKTPGAYPAGDITPGWNLLGNPFSSAITWYNGWTLPLVTTTAKIWKEGIASYTDIAAGGIIPAMQGFMVETSGATSVTIPATARTHNLQAWYKSTGNPYIRLVAHNPGAQTAQESIVTFDAQSSQGYDPYFDSRFLPGYAPYFYSVDGTEHLSTNVLQELNSQTTVPFDFIKTTGSDYFIEAVAIENVTSKVYLTDLKTSHVQILGENPIYNFTAADGDDPARFLLTFGSMVGTGEKTVINNGIYTYENNLYILNPGKATFELYTLTGQRLQKTEIDSPGLFKTTLYLPTAYYVVRLTTGTKVVVTKVFIKS
ncbi:MAG: T9SS type A sorting domain-containing protein [Bacteroidota bacterium]